ncbi:MAG: hypothetical protein HYT38_00440 [Candidatus Sungbacteria bacterium]|uniref:Uncharacterized protein n=1 Tax=Candidatus Sungiibacteriota bacterium TaxID=2750080 RepID=A0A931YDG7_9BACT|nr:hypothetical protein [Candidatus Sungbacteria bacterium]MBI2465849.1 hypothetical protein [Candidatus Sungbacteria bacterium]
MLNGKDITKLISLFVTKEDLADLKSDLPTKADINSLHNSIDRFMVLHEKLDQEFTIMKEDINRMKVAIRSMGGKVK